MSFKHGGYLAVEDVQGSTTSTFLEDGFFDFLDKVFNDFWLSCPFYLSPCCIWWLIFWYKMHMHVNVNVCVCGSCFSSSVSVLMYCVIIASGAPVVYFRWKRLWRLTIWLLWRIYWLSWVCGNFSSLGSLYLVLYLMSIPVFSWSSLWFKHHCLFRSSKLLHFMCCTCFPSRVCQFSIWSSITVWR